MRRISAFVGHRVLALHFPMVSMLFFALIVSVGPLGVLAADAVSQDSEHWAKRQAEISKLIDELGSESFFNREQAQRNLKPYGIDAFDALAAATNAADIEIAARAQHLLGLIEIPWTDDNDPTAVLRQLQGYESMDDEDRQERIEQLAVLLDDEGLQPLCRIVRFEPSQVLSKIAATAIIGQFLTPLDDTAHRGKVIVDALSMSQRPAAAWVRAYVQSFGTPHIAAAKFEEFIAQEAATLQDRPHWTDAEILTALRKHQIKLLTHLERRDQALEQMEQIVSSEDGSPDSLLLQLSWLKENQGWEMIDRLAKRFGAQFDEEPILLYALAHARQLNGRQDEADALATKAGSMNPGDFVTHWQTALQLSKNGLPWAEQEYRAVTTTVPEGNVYGILAQRSLSEILHDRADHFGAANVLQEMARQMEKNIESGTPDQNYRLTVEEIRARMHFFLACHFAAEKDFDKQLDHLKQAVKEDPQDADALIALYRFHKSDTDQQAEVSSLIQNAATAFQQNIDEDPDPDYPTDFNQYAWLVGNTEGDQHKAMQYSRKSLEIRPNSAAYLDTLARCYFKQGDLRSAMRYQMRAVKLDPQSHQMKRQLEEIRQSSTEATPE